MDKELIKYYLIMYRYNTDPMIKIHYLVKIKELFSKEKMPAGVQEFVEHQAVLMQKLLETSIAEKKLMLAKDDHPHSADS